ncbi:unnamed protein product [Thlaspi arvense]|uniref:Uncharacterized protein n=1 Tax=Thlaspi arvense TaxID=13288 RepID=A0AAU9SDG8_THLAR|nr:unnamed protein product [Thlaspi arvense]
MTPHGKKGIHKHCASPQNFLKIEYDMMAESGLDEPPPYTDLVQEVVAKMTANDGSPHSDSQGTSTAATSATPTRILLNQEFLKLRNFTLTESIHESHTLTVDMDMRISGLEANTKAVNINVETLKEDVVAMRGEFKEELATVKNEMVAVLNAFLQKVGTTPISTTAADASPHRAAAASTNPANTTNPSQQKPTLHEMCAVLLRD